MNWHDHITSDPEILSGKPIVKGTRTSVKLVRGWLAQGWSHELLLESYPHLKRDDILASLAFAAEMLPDEDYLAKSKAAREHLGCRPVGG